MSIFWQPTPRPVAGIAESARAAKIKPTRHIVTTQDAAMPICSDPQLELGLVNGRHLRRPCAGWLRRRNRCRRQHCGAKAALVRHGRMLPRTTSTHGCRNNILCLAIGPQRLTCDSYRLSLLLYFWAPSVPIGMVATLTPPTRPCRVALASDCPVGSSQQTPAE